MRGHWEIENNLHWQLDVSFREDDVPRAPGHAPANLSVIRRFALGLLKRETELPTRDRDQAAEVRRSDEYREKVLFNT